MEYGCDFVTTVEEAKELVKKVGHPSFQLHLDSGGLYMCKENIANTIIINSGNFIHYHISEPMLAPIWGGVVDHAKGIEALKSIDYAVWASIEMRPSSFDLLKKSVALISKLLFRGGGKK